MTFFKLNGSSSTSSKKNKTTSAANTPSQTPRTSVHLTAADLAAINTKNTMTPDALEAHFVKVNMGHMQALSMSRI
jgi:activator of HSP90 ATPase